jgi:hypothetical protein
MRLRNRQRNDLVSLLRRRVEITSDGDLDWLVGVEVACAVQDMEWSLQRAGLGNGIEPAGRLMRP